MSRIPTRRAAVVSYTERDDLHPAVEQRAQVVEAALKGWGQGPCSVQGESCITSHTLPQVASPHKVFVTF